MKEYINKWASEFEKLILDFKEINPDFGLLEDIELFITIVFYLIAIGIAAPIVLWLARRIYKSVKKTRETVKK